MKNKILLSIFILFFALSAFVGCQNTGGDNSSVSDTDTSISTPADLRIDGGYLLWNAVDGVDLYKVCFNGVEYTMMSNEFALPDNFFGEADISVVAVKGEKSSEKAELKTVVKYQLAAPSNLSQQGDKIFWDAVRNASYYIVRINDEEYRSDVNEYPISATVKGEVRVLAAGNMEGSILSSDFSAPITLKTTLSTPDGVRYSDGMIKWNAVEDADGYYLTINGIGYTVNKNEIKVKYLFSGIVTFSVKAFSNNASVADSSVKTVELNIEKAVLSVPENVSIQDGELLFDAVEGASGYEIWCDGEYVEIINATSYTLTQTDVSYVQVRAVSDVADASPLSEKMIVNVHTIATEAELSAMKEGGCYKLLNDIVLVSARVPVAFSGVLDGDGHSIENVVIDSSEANVGFFSSLENATVKNLTIKGSISVETNKSEMAVGALAGKCVGSHIENCVVEFTVNAKTVNGVGVAGGVAGLFENSSAKNVVFKGTVETDNAITGGFIGKADDPSALNTVENCSVVDNTIVFSKGGEQCPCGGFVGKFTDNCLQISACFADCEVTGSCYVGGFVGYMGSGRIRDCYTSGSVTADSDALVHLGGFIGRLEGYNNNVVRCIAMTKVNGETAGDNILVGGFVGKTVGGNYNSVVYEKCFYDNTVNSIDRIGKGRGDGILAISTENLKKASSYQGYDLSVWDIEDGKLPSLK